MERVSFFTTNEKAYNVYINSSFSVWQLKDDKYNIYMNEKNCDSDLIKGNLNFDEVIDFFTNFE